MDRTGNRVPISGNIISVTRPTASKNVGRCGRRPCSRIPRDCARRQTWRKTPGPVARETQEGGEKKWPIAALQSFCGRNRCVISRSTFRERWRWPRNANHTIVWKIFQLAQCFSVLWFLWKFWFSIRWRCRPINSERLTLRVLSQVTIQFKCTYLKIQNWRKYFTFFRI